MGHQADAISEALLQRIRTGSLIPGDSLDEETLCDEFKVSGTPVREALIHLEAANLIERLPRAGARVFLPDTERLISLIEMHAEIEGSVAQFAARRINTEQADVLLKATEDCEAFAVAHDSAVATNGYYPLNINFHMSIQSANNNADLSNLMLTSANRLISYFRARHRLRGEPERSAKEHRVIAESILSGEAGKARDLMIRHVIIDGATILDVIKKMQERF